MSQLKLHYIPAINLTNLRIPMLFGDNGTGRGLTLTLFCTYFFLAIQDLLDLPIIKSIKTG